MELDEELPSALGIVVEGGRGSLPFALIHGEALVTCAAWAVGEAGVELVDFSTPWSTIAAEGEAVLMHDPLCPMTPPSFLDRCVRAASERGTVVVGVRPVTDTVKEVEDDMLGQTLDRDQLLQVTSPIVLPADVAASLDGPPSEDFAALALSLASRFPVRTVVAPTEGRRVANLDDVRILEALVSPGSGE